METNNILLLLLVLVVLAVILVLFFTMKKKDSVVGVFSLDNNLPRTADAPLKINVLMHDTKNNKLKVNIDGKELTLFTSKLNKDEYKGTVLQSEKFTKQATTSAGQDDITILVSGDMLFYNQSPPASDSDKPNPSKCGYYFKNKGSKLMNLNGTYQKDKDDKTGLVIDMKDPVVLNVTNPTTFSFKLIDNDGKEAGGPFPGAIAFYSPYISISLKDLNVPNWSSYTWMGSLNVVPEQPDKAFPIFISGDLQNVLYLEFQKDGDRDVIIATNPQIFTRQ
jgi:hypothetical protein